MRCDEFESRLHHCLDRRRDPSGDRLLVLHAESCAACRQFMAACTSLAEGLTQLGRPECPGAAGERVLCELAASPPVDHRRWLTPLLASAAAILVLASVRNRTPSPATLADAAVAARSSDAAVVAVETSDTHNVAAPAAPVGVLARQASEKYADLARDTRDALSGMSLLLPEWDQSLLPPDTSADVPVDLAVDRLAHEPSSPVIAQVAAGLRPLADSTTGAMSFLLNMLPQTQPPPGSPPQAVGEAAAPLVRQDTI